MNTNCLVTKLKSVVNNDNLPFMNGLHIWVNPQPDASKLYSISVKNASEKCPAAWENGITVYSNGVAYSSPQEIPFGNDSNYGITNTTDSYKLLIIKNTKNLKYFYFPIARGIKEEFMQLDNLAGGNFRDICDLNNNPIYYSADWVNRALANNTEIVSILIDDLNGLDSNIFSNPNTNVNRTINLSGSTLPATTTGDITRFTNIVCKSIKINDTKVTGDIKNLKVSSNCRAVSFYRSNMTGDIIEFVPAMINRGLTSGIDLTYFHSADAYTFNGNHPSISSPTLYWESASKMFIKNRSSKDIWCYGYTDGEITERRSSDPLWTDTTNVTKMD